jgi:hypothetical protein
MRRHGVIRAGVARDLRFVRTDGSRWNTLRQGAVRGSGSGEMVVVVELFGLPAGVVVPASPLVCSNRALEEPPSASAGP